MLQLKLFGAVNNPDLRSFRIQTSLPHLKAEIPGRTGHTLVASARFDHIAREMVFW